MTSVAVMTGCAPDAAAPVAPILQADIGRAVQQGTNWDLPLDNEHQLERAFPKAGCHGSRYRQFDFWVGEWNVTSPAGVPGGTNIVTSDLGGCLVTEHWTAVNGSRGLSLNSYDRETDLWYQTWSSQTPQAIFGRLRTMGGIVDGAMLLTGTRAAAAGFTFRDTWNWVKNDQGQVIQSASAAVPELNFLSQFTGIYTTGVVTPATPLVSTFCSAGAIGGDQRAADFLLGTWIVTDKHGHQLGTSEIVSDLSDCLLVERFTSSKGLQAISFTYVDLWVEHWFRSYVDDQGERMELEGGFQDGALVLQGPEKSHGSPVDVRISWEPDGVNVKQVWSVSKDGGTSWRTTAELIYSPA